MKRNNDLKEFVRCTGLSVMGMLGVSCYILADTYFISKGLGTRGLTALNLAIPAYNFIHGTGLMLGMGGAVLATGLSPLISMAVISGHKIKRSNTFKAVKGLSDRRDMGKVLSTGMPSLVGQLSLGVVMMVFNFLILGIRGNIGVAAYGVIANISIVVEGVLTGIAQGIQPLVSRFYGTGATDRAAATLRRAMVAVAASSAVIYGVIFIFSVSITAAFNSEGSESMAAMAVQGLRLYFISTPFMGCNVVISIFFSSTEREGAARRISLLRGFCDNSCRFRHGPSLGYDGSVAVLSRFRGHCRPCGYV